MVTVEPITAAGLVSSSITLPNSNGNGVQAKTEALQIAQFPTLKSTNGEWEASLALARLEMNEIARKIIDKEIPPKKIVLDNGLTIIADEAPDETSCNVRVYVKVGSAYEGRKNNGIAHFVEHYLFNGTNTPGRTTQEEILDQFEIIGSDKNAETERETTAYYSDVLSCFAPLTLDILLDMVFNPSLDEKYLDKEKGVVKEELNMYKDSPEYFTEDMLFRYIWRNHFGRLIIGTKDSIAGMTKESMMQFVNDFYTPDNIIISIAGKFDLEKMIEIAKRHTAHITRKKKEVELPKSNYSSGIKIFKRRDIEQTQLLFALEGIPYTSKDWYVMRLLEQCLTDLSSSRLFQGIREKNGLAYSVDSASEQYSSCGVFAVSAGIPGESLEFVVRLILDELKSIKDKGLTEKEITRAKMQLKDRDIASRRELEDRASMNATDEIYFGRFRSLKEDIERTEAITNDDIMKLAKKLFRPEYFTLLLMAPRDVDRDKQIPTREKLEAIFKEYELKWSKPDQPN